MNHAVCLYPSVLSTGYDIMIKRGQRSRGLQKDIYYLFLWFKKHLSYLLAKYIQDTMFQQINLPEVLWGTTERWRVPFCNGGEQKSPCMHSCQFQF